jgi:hypothetical protein
MKVKSGKEENELKQMLDTSQNERRNDRLHDGEASELHRVGGLSRMDGR